MTRSCGSYDAVALRYDQGVVAYDGADDGAAGEFQLHERFADNVGGFQGERFDGLGVLFIKRSNREYLAPANELQDAVDGAQVRIDHEVDAEA